MTLSVADRGTAQQQITEAANALGRSEQRIAVFREIHSGRSRIKTATAIAKAIGLVRKRVLEEAVKLRHKHIVSQTTRDGDVAYERDNFYYVHRDQIIKQARRWDHLQQRPVRSTQLAPKRPRHRRLAIRAKGVRRRPRCDVFLSHASEDKKAIARPLANALKR